MLIKQLLVLTAAMLVLVAFNQVQKSPSAQTSSEEIKDGTITQEELED